MDGGGFGCGPTGVTSIMISSICFPEELAFPEAADEGANPMAGEADDVAGFDVWSILHLLDDDCAAIPAARV
jgi:hypothetical protein